MTTILWIVLGLVVLLGIAYGIRSIKKTTRRFQANLYAEALAAILDNRKEEALAKLRAAAQADSANLDAYLRLGNLYRDKGELDRAIQIHRSLLVRKGLTRAQEVRIYEELGRDYLAANRPQRAALVYEELVRLNPKVFKYYEDLFDLYLKIERWEEGLNLLKVMPKVQKDRHCLALYYGTIGRALLSKNQAQGMNCLKTALQLDKVSPLVLFTLGEYYFNQSQPKRAVDYWRQLLEQAPDYHFLVTELLPEAYFQLGEFDQVIPLYERLSRRLPKEPALHLTLAQLYEKKGDFVKVREILDKASRVAPEDHSLQLYQLGFLLRQGEEEEAIQNLVGLTRQLVKSEFICRGCGFRSPEFLWRCPNCGGWERFQPCGH